VRVLPYGLVFCVAFTATLLYHNTRPVPPSPAHADIRRRISTPPGVVTGTAEQAESALATFAIGDQRPAAQSVADLEERLAAEDREERAIAVRHLASIPGKDAVQTLLRVLREDPAVRNRILAIESLRRSGEAFGDREWTIRDALRTAAEEHDEVISSTARDGYDQLMTHLGAR
jgi:hypothetical protein